MRRRESARDDESEEEARLDQLDRVARDHAYKQKALRASGLSVEDRLTVSQEVLASALGVRWRERSSRAANIAYKKVWESISKPLRLPWGTDPKEMRRQQQFFSYRNLEELVQIISDAELQAPRDQFAHEFWFCEIVLEEHASGHAVPKSALARARKAKKVQDVLFTMDPAWVWALYAYPALRDHDAKTTTD